MIFWAATHCCDLGGILQHRVLCRSDDEELAVQYAKLISADPLPIRAGEWQGE